jgi:nucleoside phosphorylase
MEGFGVLRAAGLAGVPALEVRVVSNAVEDADRSRWKITDALALLSEIVPRLAPALLDVVDARPAKQPRQETQPNHNAGAERVSDRR